jgi:aryl-alcohol dehydrogenase-like predicted oxidoreductase
MTTRREFLNASGIVAGAVATSSVWPLTSGSAEASILKRKIPSTGEQVSAIGLGTSGSFQVTKGSAEYQALAEVLKRFFAGGGAIIDTAPTYGNAEDILGPLLNEQGLRSRAFIATKLSGVSGREAGLTQFNNSLKSLQIDKVELLQVHNLSDWKTQIEVARLLKAEGKVKYVGVTHFVESAQDQLADVVQTTKPDFLQINYSVVHRGAERRLFPMAKDLGVAVLANRNFEDGALFGRVKDKQLPPWSAELGISTWAQMFLKFVLSQDAVTAVIPATSKPEREDENLKAGFGPLLDPTQRAEIVALVG